MLGCKLWFPDAEFLVVLAFCRHFLLPLLELSHRTGPERAIRWFGRPFNAKAAEGGNFAFAPEPRRVGMASEDGGHFGALGWACRSAAARSILLCQVAWVLNRFAELCGCWNRPETRMTESACSDAAESTGRSRVELFIEKAVWLKSCIVVHGLCARAPSGSSRAESTSAPSSCGFSGMMVSWPVLEGLASFCSTCSDRESQELQGPRCSKLPSKTPRDLQRTGRPSTPLQRRNGRGAELSEGEHHMEGQSEGCGTRLRSLV